MTGARTNSWRVKVSRRGEGPVTAAATMQDLGHPRGHDYEIGSPHLSHPQLRNWIVGMLREVVYERFAAVGKARALEVGAGHGAFTDHLLAAGATVTVTEMSVASAELLRQRYEHNPSARVVLDLTGDATARLGERYDLVLCASVLHHIPDYLAAIRSLTALIAPGGWFLSFQDPLWYPRRTRLSLGADRGAYFAWRLLRGDLVEGVRSLARRARNVYDDGNPRDMVEYHVLRNGCDEQAIAATLRPFFRWVQVLPYWSTQSRVLQRVGERVGGCSSFAVVAKDRCAR